ncbi:DNA polymerase epsilon subunit B-like isoform X1 [Salvia splendens]|uniref:DNA polymerase epsilon subunit B-like isoform X1 n=1 Tax=Salvia splendens TaxID=180675 RepID=UPI001C2595FA|nr:DNA polymerase epsilon subunit B-like isoform X1 [Salvia splendens]
MSSKMRNKVQKKFNMRGYKLKMEALTEILGFIGRFPDAEEEALDLLLDELHNVSLKSSILDKEPVQRVVALLLEAEAAAEESPTTSGHGSAASASALRIIDAFDFPKFRYDAIKKLFHKYSGKLPIYGDAPAKVTLYRDRFMLLFQRLSRDPHFSRPVFDSDMSDYGSFQISPIQSLVGQRGKRWVMGLISQLEDGHFYLEDLTAAVEVDLSNARITTGFFVENTIVLAEGEMLMDGIFQVKTCGFPPLEDREKSLAMLAGLDFFGGGSLTKEEMVRLAELERGAVNDMFVILSDVWLDHEETMEKLEIILNGYANENVVPSLFVFMGNFSSHPCNLSFSSYSSIRSNFGRLGKMIADHQRLKEHSRFLFIPGPDDIGPSHALPRCSLPKYIIEEFQSHIPNAVFMSNPCRIRFYTQEIVFLREDMLYKMRRSCLMPPLTEETSDPFEHLVATIVHQSHLCPLPLSIQPIIWNFDHCLHLYPTPQTLMQIVLGDRSEQKAFKYTGVTCFNPGSFSNDFTFVAYRPCSQEVELSAV